MITLEMTISPGTPQHQSLLRTIVAHYDQDPRILAIVVFGSLGRGNWDALSDIDLDVLIADDARIDVVDELRQLCAAFSPLGERAALIVPDEDDAGDVVLESLMQLSVRYHPLAQTSPNIVSSMVVLAGSLDHAAIAAAGQANRATAEPPIGELLDACVRYAAGAQVYLQRRTLWLSIEILHRMRGLLMEIFTRTHGGGRSPQRFEASASGSLQARLGATLPQPHIASLAASLAALGDLMENDLENLTDGQLHLTDGQKAVLRQVSRRLELEQTKSIGDRTSQEDLLRIGRECAALSVRDSRPPEQIIGYDDQGLPR